jgi:hypothetical protein
LPGAIVEVGELPAAFLQTCTQRHTIRNSD